MGPLAGLKVVEFAGVGPAPICAMMLADLGAEVLRIERVGPSGLGVERPVEFNFILRNRHAVALDLKRAEDVATALDLVAAADALIEGFRPGVMERLGLGPEPCLARNGRLVYGRVTGWGQTGPLADTAGHDLNYIALTGALAAIGRPGGLPAPPLNLVGDFAGGGLFLAIGVLAALMEARTSGRGQVVDAGIMDGALSMMMQFFGMRAAGLWSAARGGNILDSGAPFYDVYACADGRLISVAPIEDKFFAVLAARLGLPPECAAMKRDPARWGELRALLAATFAGHDRDHWCGLLAESDACVAPVLDMDEVRHHPQIAARGALVEVSGHLQPAPAPRFSRTVPDAPRPPGPADPAAAAAILRRWLATDRAGPARFARGVPEAVPLAD